GGERRLRRSSQRFGWSRTPRSSTSSLGWLLISRHVSRRPSSNTRRRLLSTADSPRLTTALASRTAESVSLTVRELPLKQPWALIRRERTIGFTWRWLWTGLGGTKTRYG